MKDLRQILLTGLIPAIKTATGKDAYSRIPKATGITYPYIYVSDIYQEEFGSKTGYRYRLDVLIQVIYQDVTTLTGLFTDMDNILGLVKNGVTPFALSGGYKVSECNLNSSTTTEFQTETGTQSVGIIRLLFTIE
jgi:hypothetical protein